MQHPLLSRGRIPSVEDLYRCVGRRQRHSEFTVLSDEQVRAIARSHSEPTERRRRAQAEEKFREKRNVQKRGKRSR